MNRILSIGALAIIATSSAFFTAPQRASAQLNIAAAASCLGATTVGSAASTGTAAALVSVPVLDAAQLAQSTISAGANSTDCIKNTILTPLAKLLARIVLQQITASTINWITGSNGSGKSSFVTNLSRNLQGVGDAVALSFIAQTVSGFASPFGASISLALRTTYAQQTSLAGFFNANRCTLPGTPQSQRAFLAGNWSQGGVGSWFALTTQPQNNPYTLYLAAQSQLSNSIGLAQSNRRQDLIQAGGFLSWCGSSDTLAGELNAQDAQNAALESSLSGTPSPQVINPGDSCTNSDGTPGNILTPGSVIHDYTQKAVVGAGIDQLVSATDLDQALGAIAMALVSQVLGGGSGSSGGLAGASRSSAVTQLQNYAANNTAAASSAISTAQSKLTQVATYTSAWQTVAAAANTASTSAAHLSNVCTAAAASYSGSNGTFVSAATAQAAAAQTVILSKIVPVFIQARTATSSASTTQAFALKVQVEATSVSSLTSASTGAAGALTADLQTLIAMPPSSTDVVMAQQNAQAYGGATASPAGSLTVSGSSLVDQMTLISTNAAALETTVCNPSSSLYVLPGVPGGG